MTDYAKALGARLLGVREADRPSGTVPQELPEAREVVPALEAFA